ncbi:MAG TPA: HAMP domain-containing sensor histidine kinase [Flavipsychrobacter sp.]|nr:HAMP domain-containing sensor histidine kinase [Flavipsychrobacter sp.]
MQIRYKITFTYATTVAFVLILLCCSIYFLSAQDRIEQFRERMKARALTTHQLLRTEDIEPDLLKKLTRFPSAALSHKSMAIYDSNWKLVFEEHDSFTQPLIMDSGFVKNVKGGDYFFKIGERDALAFKTKNHIILIAAYDDDRIQWLSKLRFILFFSFFVSIALVIIVGYVFSLQLVGSISRIAEKLKHISTQDFSQRLEAGNSEDELQQLATTVNDLLNRLEHSFQTQSRFIDNASHELSTPLAVILSQLDIAKQKIRSKEEYEELVESVYEDVSRLDILVKSLLDLAKLSGSRSGLELFYFRIDDLMMQLPVNMKRINAGYKVKLLFEEFPEDEQDMKVYGNEALLYCAFHNIVHNACKYSPDNAAMVKLAFVNRSIHITIQDYGPGIEEEDLPFIFQPFYRSLNVNVAIQGTGLGLSLANNILKLHNGRITIETEKGIGTRFLIEINKKNL